MKLLKNKIDSLTIEKEQLLKQIKGQDNNLNNFKTESSQTSQIKKIGINKKIKNSQSMGKRYITDNLSYKNNKNYFTENKELDNKKYIDIINKLNQENVKLKNKLNEQRENKNEKEENYKNLLEENLNLKQDINELKIINKKYEEENNSIKMLDLMQENNEKSLKLKILENVNKENTNLSNKLLEADKAIADYAKKYDDVNEKYNKLKNTYKRQENILGEINNKIYIIKNKYEKMLDDRQFIQNIQNVKGKDNDYNSLQKNMNIYYEKEMN
jgi:chromosome segregation ATPase